MSGKVLFVDDEPNVLRSYQRTLRGQFEVAAASNGAQGLDLIRDHGPFAVIISDMRMPEMDGTEFLTKTRQCAPDSVRMLLTGQADMEDAVAVVNAGQIFRFLTKPCSPEALKQAVNDGIEQHRLVTAERELLNDTLKGTIKLLVDIISILSPDMFSRAVRLRSLAAKIAARLKLSNVWQVEVAALLCQIGIVTVAKEIMEKKIQGSALSQREQERFLRHIEVGRDLVRNIPRLEGVAEAIAYQEKRFDGVGLPIGDKKGSKIPQIARILKVVLDYDELISAGQASAEALTKMGTTSHMYDPAIFAALQAEVLEAEQGFVVREISARQIKVGMILGEDLRTKTNLLLVPKRQEISEALRTCIMNFAEKNNLQAPIKILERAPDSASEVATAQPIEPFRPVSA